MIINITDLAKAAIDQMLQRYDTSENNDVRKYVRIFLKEIA